MAIQAWRKGSSKREALATTPVKDQPRAVAFSAAVVKAWAKKNGVTVVTPIDAVLAASPEVQTKNVVKAKPVATKKPAPVKVARKEAASKAFTEARDAAPKASKPVKAGATKAKPTTTAPEMILKTRDPRKVVASAAA